MDGWTYTGAPDECSVHWPRKWPCAECRINNGIVEHIRLRRYGEMATQVWRQA